MTDAASMPESAGLTAEVRREIAGIWTALQPRFDALDVAIKVLQGNSRVEQFNQTVRSVVTLMLTAVFCWVFLTTTKVTADVFNTVTAGAIGYWFASRERSRAADNGALTR